MVRRMIRQNAHGYNQDKNPTISPFVSMLVVPACATCGAELILEPQA
jgi:hypothetical protein